MTWSGPRFTDTSTVGLAAMTAATRSRQKRVNSSWRLGDNQWGRMSSGPLTVPSGSCHRTNASDQPGSPAESETMGWYWKRSSVRRGARRSGSVRRILNLVDGKSVTHDLSMLRDGSEVSSRSAGIPVAPLAAAVGDEYVAMERTGNSQAAQCETGDRERDGDAANGLRDADHEFLLRWMKGNAGGASNPLHSGPPHVKRQWSAPSSNVTAVKEAPK